ncbi:hypothetical protein N2152v2_002615 [Parachlorella kessleri]
MAHEGDLEVLITTVDKLEAFNEKVKFELVDASLPLFAELAVVLLEKNVVSGDKELGSATLRLGEVYAASPASKELCIPLLSKKGKLAGELKIIATFKRYGPAAAAAGEGPCWAAIATGAANAPVGQTGTAAAASGNQAQLPMWAPVAPSQAAPAPLPGGAAAAAWGQSQPQYPALYEPPPPPAIFPPDTAPPSLGGYPLPVMPGDTCFHIYAIFAKVVTKPSLDDKDRFVKYMLGKVMPLPEVPDRPACDGSGASSWEC